MTRRLSSFIDQLGRAARNQGFVLSRWDGARKHTRNLQILRKSGNSLVLYIKDSGLDAGFWGLNEPQLDSLRRRSGEWLVVLLCPRDSGESGWVLSSDFVDSAIQARRWTFSGDDWKLHEDGIELRGALLFEDYDTLISHLLVTAADGPAQA